MKTFLTTLVATGACLTLAAQLTAQTRTFSGQYSFGDSLSDSGNLYALSNRTQPPAPYYNGRFSNGPVFVELLGNPILPAAPLSSAGTNRNFAFGGATAGTGSTVPNLSAQVAAYRLQGLPAKSTDLFTVLAGPNDLIPVLSAPTTPGNPAALDTAGVNAAQAVATNVRALVGLGAKNLVVLGMPNLGATPRALASGGPGGAGSILGLRATNAFNQELRARLAAIAAEPAAADVNLVYTDLQGVLDRIASDYASLGYTNGSSAYLGGGSGDPENYVFWDEIHPTAKTHRLLASIVTEQLNPEIPLGFAAAQGTAALALSELGVNAVDARASQLAVSRRAVGRLDAYATFNYADANRSRDGWRPKFEYTAQTLTGGVDLQARDGIFLGAAVSGGRLEAELTGGRGDFTVEDGTGRLYSVWRGGPVSLLLDANYGTLTVKEIRRATAFGGLRTSGKTSGNHWGAGLKAMWAVDVGAVNVRPWFGLRTERVELDGYAEKDVPALTMEFAEQEARSSTGAVGVDAATSWKLGAQTLRFDVRGAWHGELGSRTRNVAGRLADNFTRLTTIDVEDGDGSGFEAGGALTLFFSRNWSTSLGYAADIRSGERVAHRGTLSLQTGF